MDATASLALGPKTGATSAKLDTSSASVLPGEKRESPIQKDQAGLINSRPKSAGNGKKAKTATIQATADKAMSQYIRQKYAKDGFVSCVSCGVSIPWQEADCGHFVPKSRGASIRYVEENCHPECKACNRFDEGHLAGYTLFMIDTYGREKIDELKAESRKTLTATAKRRMAEEAIVYYREAMRVLI